MAVEAKEYLFSISEFKEPKIVKDREAIALLLVRLIMMDPGTDPLHPTMGLGLRKNYRYTVNKLDELKSNLQNQLDTFLPEFHNTNINIVITPEKLCNIEITINNVVYVYESATAPIPITLSDIESN